MRKAQKLARSHSRVGGQPHTRGSFSTTPPRTVLTAFNFTANLYVLFDRHSLLRNNSIEYILPALRIMQALVAVKSLTP